jgi:hypothetical protein
MQLMAISHILKYRSTLREVIVPVDNCWYQSGGVNF